MNEPKTITLPDHITTAMNLIDAQVNALMQTKFQLLATHLKAEQIQGKWGLVEGNTHAVQSEELQQKQENA